MAINEVIFPTVPNPVSGDWSKAIELIEMAMQNINNPVQVNGSNIPQGSTFQVGGHVYYTDSDTTITGTLSKYVKLTINGTTLVPSFVVNLTGVTWNKIYNGYYDTSDNLYVFNEFQAYSSGEVSSLQTKEGKLSRVIKGKADITLSNYDNDSASQIQEGSVFENRGKLIEVESDVTPIGYSGISNSTLFYLYYDESAGAFIYSSTAPTWSDSKQGWYNGNDRAFFSMYKDSGGTLYQLKTKLQDQNNIKISNIETLNSGSSWTVPANVYRVKAIIIGAGGGGASGASSGGEGSNGGSTTFNSEISIGGIGGNKLTSGADSIDGFVSGNGGGEYSTQGGTGGQIRVLLFSVLPGDSISYSIGAGGAGGAGGSSETGGDGGNGQIILEY